MRKFIGMLTICICGAASAAPPVDGNTQFVLDTLAENQRGVSIEASFKRSKVSEASKAELARITRAEVLENERLMVEALAEIEAIRKSKK